MELRSLEERGIPLHQNGHKLIITSRSLDVCRRMCERNIKVEPLSGEEAWKLFTKTHGYALELPADVQKIAKEMTRRCEGLPLGIITTARSMKGLNDIHEWRDALEELKKSPMGQADIESGVFPILQYSFNRLKNTKLQACFLYCSLYPEDNEIPRVELISKTEGLMDRRTSRQAEFDQGHIILNRLENFCLLENADKSVKMHALLRDMALKIKQNESKFMVQAKIRLKQLPEEQEWKEDLEKVSLMWNNISEIRPGTSPKCPKLSTFILRRNPVKSIPYSFFVNMSSLRVLDLRETDITELPDSISNLEDLTALLLGVCRQLKSIPCLQKLKTLKELDLGRTKIMEVPKGMENLTNLKSLCMNEMYDLSMIPLGVLPKLSRLQSLSVPQHVQVLTEELLLLKELEVF